MCFETVLKRDIHRNQPLKGCVLKSKRIEAKESCHSLCGISNTTTMKYDITKAVKDIQPVILYNMCLKVKDVNTGEIFAVDLREYLSNLSIYEVLDSNGLVPDCSIY